MYCEQNALSKLTCVTLRLLTHKRLGGPAVAWAASVTYMHVKHTKRCLKSRPTFRLRDLAGVSCALTAGDGPSDIAVEAVAVVLEVVAAVDVGVHVSIPCCPLCSNRSALLIFSTSICTLGKE